MKGSDTPNQARIKITKLDAARRQIETAIVLFFNGGDLVSAHTLAAAAREILSNLNRLSVGQPMLMDARDEIIRPEKRKFAREKIREAQNFFKHADEDSSAVLDFNPEATAFYIFDAVEKYRELTSEGSPVLRVFSLWFRVRWPEVFKFRPDEERKFAGLRSLRLIDNKAEFFAHFLVLYTVEQAKQREP